MFIVRDFLSLQKESHSGEIKGQCVGSEELMGDDSSDAKPMTVFQRLGERAEEAIEISLYGFAEREFINLQRNDLHLPATTDSLACLVLRQLYAGFIQDGTRAGISSAGQTRVHKKQDWRAFADSSPRDDEMIAGHPERNDDLLFGPGSLLQLLQTRFISGV